MTHRTKTAGVTGLELTEEDLILINRHTQRELSADEVFAFKVTLCDNQVDRDGERFSTAALHTLAELFVGKPGIFDHNPKASGQTARIFAARVEEDPDGDSVVGEPYAKLLARAYMLRDDSTMATIRSIEAGILKEVSVGCAVARVTCSICGKDQKGEGCAHRKGNSYDGVSCYHLLEEPTDAYEWSFVAVPAQRGAGVTKKHTKSATGDLETLLIAFRETLDLALAEMRAAREETDPEEEEEEEKSVSAPPPQLMADVSKLLEETERSTKK